MNPELEALKEERERRKELERLKAEKARRMSTIDMPPEQAGHNYETSYLENMPNLDNKWVSRPLSFGRGAADVALFGFDDELDNMLPGKLPFYNATEVKKQQMSENPVSSALGQIGAGFAVPAGAWKAGASLLGNAARGAVAGGAYGGLYGLGSGEGEASERLPDVLGGVLAGSALGAGFPLAVPVLRPLGRQAQGLGARVVDSVSKRIPKVQPTDHMGAHNRRVAREAVQRSMNRSNVTPEKLQQNIEGMRGKPAVGAEVAGQDALNTAAAISRREGVAPELARGTMDERVAGAPGRFMQDVQEVTGVRADAIDGNVQGMMEIFQQQAAPLYKQAFEAPFVRSQRLQGLLDNDVEVASAARKAINRVKARVEREGIENPSELMIWDETKKIIDDRITQLQRAGKDNQARDLISAAGIIRQEADAAVPAYAAARRIGGEAPRIRDAHKKGLKAAKSGMQPREVQALMDKMGEPELEAFKGGFVQSLTDDIQNGRFTPSRFNAPAMKDKVRAILGGKAGDDLIERMGVEAQLRQTGSRLNPNVGSVTSQAMGPKAGDQLVQAGAHVVTGNKIGLIKQMIDLARARGYSQDQLDEMAKLLYAPAEEFGEKMGARAPIPGNLDGPKGGVERLRMLGFLGDETGAIGNLSKLPRKNALDMSTDARMARAKEQRFDTGQKLYHGSPDMRDLKASNAFEARSREATRRGGGGERARLEKEIAAEYAANGSSNRYFDLLDKIGKLTTQETVPKAIYFTPNRGVAKTYSNQDRAFDYQNAEPGIIEAYTRGNLLEINAGGSKFSDVSVDRVRQQIPENKLSEFDQLILEYADPTNKGKIRTGDIETIAAKMGFDGFRLKNVKDTYDGSGPPTEVIAVFDPKNIRRTDAKFDPANADKPDLNGFSTTEPLSTMLGGSGGAVAGMNSDIDVNGDGEIDWRDKAIAAGTGFAVGAGVGYGAGRGLRGKRVAAASPAKDSIPGNLDGPSGNGLLSFLGDETGAIGNLSALGSRGAVLNSVQENPTNSTIRRMMTQMTRDGTPPSVRLVKTEDGKVYAFDGWNHTHDDFAEAMGLDPDRIGRGIIDSMGTDPRSVKFVDRYEQPFEMTKRFPEGTSKVHFMNKAEYGLTPSELNAVEDAFRGEFAPDRKVLLAKGRKKLAEHGVEVPRGGQGRPADVSVDVKRLLDDGLDNQQIAERLGISPNHVAAIKYRASRGGFSAVEPLSTIFGGSSGYVGAQDLNGDGEVSPWERGVQAAAGAGLGYKGSQLLSGKGIPMGLNILPKNLPQKKPNSPQGTGQMVAGTALGIGAGIPTAVVMSQSTPAAQQARQERQQVVYDTMHENMLRDSEYRRRYQEQIDKGVAREEAIMNARNKEREAIALENHYQDVDNMPTDSRFNMNGWAEKMTGVSSQFLNDLIGQESANDWDAANPESTARGGTQFIESTWLRMLDRHGKKFGLDDGLSRQEKLDLRNDPRWGTIVASQYALENAKEMQRRLGGQITQKQAYLAHFLGVDAAVKAYRSDPNKLAAEVFPRAARANPNVFYHGGDPHKPRTILELIARQGSKFSDEPLMVWDTPMQMMKPEDNRVDRFMPQKKAPELTGAVY